MNETLKLKLANLPLEPGCYMMKDKHGEIIYVGKAKKLKNRVNSYFTGAHNFKTTKLVSQIVDFDIIVTSSEKEALLLEINSFYTVPDKIKRGDIKWLQQKYGT